MFKKKHNWNNDIAFSILSDVYSCLENICDGLKDDLCVYATMCNGYCVI